MIHQYGKEIYKPGETKILGARVVVGGAVIVDQAELTEACKIIDQTIEGYEKIFMDHKITKWEYFKEWARCLLSPNAAKQTWLRVTDQEEERISRFAYATLAFLVIANIGVWYAGHVRHQNAIKNAKQEIIIEQGCDMYPDICFQVEAI